MEKINAWFSTNVQDSLVNALKMINYCVYIMEWPIIVVGFIIAATLVWRNRKKYSYRYELSIWLKISMFMVATAYFIKVLNVKAIIPIFDTIFYNFMPITILGIIIAYLLDIIIFYKRGGNRKVEIRYLKYTITITYTFLLLSSMYGLKDIILPLIWQVVLISIKFWAENEENVSRNNNCILYETRKKQLSTLMDIIKNSNYENYAIAINGEWGSGKSELISALIDDRSNGNYYVYIKPMVTDTQESLIREFQKGISKLMKCNGIYSGRNSSLDKYFKEILKLIQFNNKVTLSDFIELTYDDSSYKDLKKELQGDLDSLLDTGSKRIIVVIDDFDRVNEDKQIEILSFIKEVIDFKGCITIIALDYENLKDNKIIKPLYLEKFIATQLPLVNMDFEEIIKFHSKDILKEICLENDFSKEILKELNVNIYNFYNDIEKRITNYCKKEEANISKSNQNTDKMKSDLNEFFNFAIERSKHINNSRRVIHFLNEIQNTVIYIDKLYKDRYDGEKLLNTVKVSEIVYFFNFVKVFYKDAYESIVKLNGIEEYCADLFRKDKKLEEKYFTIILGDIFPQSTYLFTDETKDLSRSNTLNLVKDIFINYYFSKNNIELFTNSQKCINEIDNNNISINEKFSENIKIYQDAIFKYSKDTKEIIERITSLINYIIELYEQEKIDFATILEMATYRDIVYANYYLKEAYKLVNKSTAKKIYENDKWRIKSILSELEVNNITHYRHIFIELLIIATLDKSNDTDIDGLFKELMNSEQLFKKMKEYSTENGLIKEQDNPLDLIKLITLLINKVKSKEYIILDLELLILRVEEFLLNNKYISKLQNIELKIDMIDRYKQVSQSYNIKSIYDAKEILKDLAKEQILDSNMVGCFQKIIRYIISEGTLEEVSDECKGNVIIIFNKMKREDLWNEYQWFDIMVNVERISKF